MIKSIHNVFLAPMEAPVISKAAIEFLQNRLNMAQVAANGDLDRFRSGNSEAATLGFLMGLQYACDVLDDLTEYREQTREEE
ncbi:hypothetical protein RU59_00024 [Enterobacter phage phiEap-1]|uniref:Uncharacterized protein n=1 Tax=Enterobacter phage phiEap-1 TaxID=1587520 RepID=A0A0K2FGW4_9CAUD|nr:hypothetical protein RU59_00024 [Enterobacter phage phiEap-1]ALA45087.1 hypothetical protein RU59_00024 [Enterobacter phage phiEap-1]